VVVPSVEYFAALALSRRSEFENAGTVVEFATAFVERAVLHGDNHLYADPYVLVQLASGAQGACFLHGSDLRFTDLDLLPGRQAWDVLSGAAPYLRIALLDAIYCQLNEHDGIRAGAEVEFRGTGSEKSRQRARKIVELCCVAPGMRIALVGLIVDIARQVREAGGELKVADLAEAGTEVLDVVVELDAEPLVRWADAVIMTGNTLKTETLGRLLGAIDREKRVVVYAMTGHHVAARYVDSGVDVVTAEGFPYYWYAATPSTMRIYWARAPESAVPSRGSSP
jgi:hypothetical protein